MLALTRFGAAARADPIHKAGNALGKLCGVSLCDYLSNEGFRREILRILNRANRSIMSSASFTCSIAAARGRRPEELWRFRLTDLAHQYGHGLDNPAYATGLGQVAADWTRRIEPDLLRHIGPMHCEHQLSWGDGVSASTLPESSDPGLSSKTGHETHGTDGS